jgi:hypothetical protein
VRFGETTAIDPLDARAQKRAGALETYPSGM